MLKIAIPNKGSLSEKSQLMLREAGYRQRYDSKDLVLVDAENEVEFYYLRPRDIAVYVGEKTLDLGITGRDMLLDSGASAKEIMALGFGGTKFRFAAPEHCQYSLAELAGKRIASSYPGLLRSYLEQHGITARLIKLDGAVESSIRLGIADVIADVVETGSTLKKAGLKVFGEPILYSEAILIQNSETENIEGLAQLRRRLEGVITARNYYLVDYNIAKANLAAASLVTPGLESPTISPLANSDWVAVRAMIPRKQAQKIMDELQEIGAEAILVTGITACRL